ncbi:hypothetical protein DL767_005415 [Monosporascus sp. MG133]|nr:hypothetical protein DL767_005415 [Monosporascus sp. MG133]
MKQSFPGKPNFTAKEVPNLTNKVIIVTRSNTGLGKGRPDLYSKDAKVCVMAQSQEKTRKAINSIKMAVPKSAGDLAHLPLDLADLVSVKASADEFLR